MIVFVLIQAIFDSKNSLWPDVLGRYNDAAYCKEFSKGRETDFDYILLAEGSLRSLFLCSRNKNRRGAPDGLLAKRAKIPLRRWPMASMTSIMSKSFFVVSKYLIPSSQFYGSRAAESTVLMLQEIICIVALLNP